MSQSIWVTRQGMFCSFNVTQHKTSALWCYGTKIAGHAKPTPCPPSLAARVVRQNSIRNRYVPLPGYSEKLAQGMVGLSRMQFKNFELTLDRVKFILSTNYLVTECRIVAPNMDPVPNPVTCLVTLSCTNLFRQWGMSHCGSPLAFPHIALYSCPCSGSCSFPSLRLFPTCT